MEAMTLVQKLRALSDEWRREDADTEMVPFEFADELDAIVTAHLAQPAQAVDEQAVFEAWLERTSPSGDAESVRKQWEASADRANLVRNTSEADVERVLAALGHVCVPNTRCTSRVAETPPELRPPGPQNPPMWCCLPAGHEGQHRHNGGGMYASIPFRDTDEVVIGTLPDTCAKCRRIWPCDDAEAITRALSGEKAGPAGDGWQPIETAPKDGTSVLLAFGGKKPVGGWWNDNRYAKVPRPYWSADNERIVGIPWLRSNPPIAWMPLPASPTPGKEGA